MTDQTDGVLEDQPDQNRFVFRVDGVEVGLADYRRAPGALHIVHTEVDPHRRGRGVGGDMVRAILDGLRADSADRVVADCPFVRSWLDAHPDYADLELTDR